MESRLRTGALALSLTLITACGSPAAPASNGDTLAPLFGLQSGRCFEYSSAGSADGSRLGVTITADIDQFEVPTYHLFFRAGTQPAMEEWVAPQEGALQLYKRRYFGTGSRQAVYTPPMPLARTPLRAGGPDTSTAIAEIRDASSGVLLVDPSVSHTLTVTVFGDATAGYRHVYVETPSRGLFSASESRTLVPQQGWTSLDLDLSSDGSGPLSHYQLENTYDEPAAVARCGFN